MAILLYLLRSFIFLLNKWFSTGFAPYDPDFTSSGDPTQSNCLSHNFFFIWIKLNMEMCCYYHKLNLNWKKKTLLDAQWIGHFNCIGAYHIIVLKEFDWRHSFWRLQQYIYVLFIKCKPS